MRSSDGALSSEEESFTAFFTLLFFFFSSFKTGSAASASTPELSGISSFFGLPLLFFGGLSNSSFPSCVTSLMDFFSSFSSFFFMKAPCYKIRFFTVYGWRYNCDIEDKRDSARFAHDTRYERSRKKEASSGKKLVHNG